MDLRFPMPSEEDWGASRFDSPGRRAMFYYWSRRLRFTGCGKELAAKRFSGIVNKWFGQADEPLGGERARDLVRNT